MTVRTSKKRASAMYLDMRGRLVANPEALFGTGLVQGEIDAARALGKALTALREKKRRNRTPSSQQPRPA